jgi:hypothetical protein
MDKRRKILALKYGGKDNVTSVDEAGYRRFRVNGLWGLCLADGQLAVSPQFTKLYHFDPVSECWRGIKKGRIVLIRLQNGEIVVDDEQNQLSA